jgi:hypothetical protein
MPPGRDWRTPADEAEDETLQYPDIAIGYLSRNPRYRADYQRALDLVEKGVVDADAATADLIGRWGMSFRAAPASAFDPKQAVSKPELSPASVVMEPAPVGFTEARPLEAHALGAVRARMTIGDDTHLILADPGGDHRLWIRGQPDRPLAFMLPYGGDLKTRLAAAERLRRRLRGISCGPPPLLMTATKRHRLLTLLRAVDGRDEGASARELAVVLISQAVADYSAAEWVDCRERKQIGRWMRTAFELVDHGYLRLLRGG